MSNAILTKIYYDPAKGFVSASQLYNKLTPSQQKKISLKEVKEFISKQETAQLHKPPTKKKVFYPIIGENGTYQIDLTFYEQYKAQNTGYYIILTAIEVNSRLAVAVALKNKRAETILEAFDTIHKEASKSNFPMKVIGFDKGSEFQTFFQKHLDKLDIEYYIADPIIGKNSMAMVERFNRTLRERLEKYMTAYNTSKWINVLPQTIKNYNNTRHGTTGFKPSQVRNKEILEINQQQNERIREAHDHTKSFNLGDTVRKIKPKGILDKKSGENFYRQTYTIAKINPFSYRLKNDEGTLLKERYKAYQLQPIGAVQTFNSKETRSFVDRDTLKEQHRASKRLKRENLK